MLVLDRPFLVVVNPTVVFVLLTVLLTSSLCMCAGSCARPVRISSQSAFSVVTKTSWSVTYAGVWISRSVILLLPLPLIILPVVVLLLESLLVFLISKYFAFLCCFLFSREHMKRTWVSAPPSNTGVRIRADIACRWWFRLDTMTLGRWLPVTVG